MNDIQVIKNEPRYLQARRKYLEERKRVNDHFTKMFNERKIESDISHFASHFEGRELCSSYIAAVYKKYSENEQVTARLKRIEHYMHTFASRD
jgi:hypothetical protein